MIYRPRLRRKDVPQYLAEKFGLPITKATLEKMAVNGGGPRMEYYGRFPLYRLEDLDAWASERLSMPVYSTSERQARQ